MNLFDPSHFACIAAEKGAFSNDLALPVELGNDVWIYASAPFGLPEYWREWLGSLRSEVLTESNFLIFAFMHSGEPSLGQFQPILRERVYEVLYSLALQGTQSFKNLMLIGGAFQRGHLDIKTVSDPHDISIPFHTSWLNIDSKVIDSTKDCLGSLRFVFSGKDYMHFRRGFNVWLEGKSLKSPASRLHQFVRSIEALIRPEQGRTQKQFVHRCQTFTGASPRNAKILEEIYKLRSAAEHLKDIADALDDVPERELEVIALTRAYQAEILCEFVLRKILVITGLRDVFLDGNTMNEFWAKDDRARKMIWGEQINLEAETKARYDIMKYSGHFYAESLGEIS